MKRILKTSEALHAFNSNPNLFGGFGQDFGNRLVALDRYDNQPKFSTFSYKFLKHQKNIQQTVHGGALTTMIDVATTIGMLRMTPHRTISISLSTQFLTVIKLQEEVQIDTQITKIGKNIVFADCRIFTDPHNNKKLACKGQHIKSIMPEHWNFMQQVV